MKNLKKSSFTLIELIVAIIIVGIVITSIPMLLTNLSKSQSINEKEKSFFNAYALLTLIQTQEWDQNNTYDKNYKKVLTSDHGDPELKCPRIGVKQLANNDDPGKDNYEGAACASDYNKTSHIGTDGETSVEEYNDIDDFDGYYTTVNDFNISVKVSYMDDNNTDYSQRNLNFTANNLVNHDSNIKFVKLNITNKNTHKEIAVLKYFTSNIGAVQIVKADK
jgi:prepilin-type N-terminal cleavage/methylation domain-containing protein